MKGRWILLATGLVTLVTATTSDTPVAGATPSQAVVKELVRGAPLHGANGMYFGPDGCLYVASVLGGYITVMDPTTGRIVRRIGDAGAPDDLTFGPDGALYWTDIVGGNVWKMTVADGTRQTIATGLPGVNPITFSADGRLFVARDFLGVGLYELDPNGVNPPVAVLPDLVNLNGFDFGPDGWLYGPLVTEGTVVRINVDTKEQQAVITGLAGPAAAKFNAQGELFVVDQLEGKVYQIELPGGNKTLVGDLHDGLDNLAIDPLGNIFVSNADDGDVVRLLPSRQGQVISPGGMVSAGGVAVRPRSDGGESVYVGDIWTLREFDGRTGRAMSTTRASIVGTLAQPGAVAWDGQYLILGSPITGLVQVYDPIAGAPAQTYPFTLPLGVTRFQGDVVVSNLGSEGQVLRVAQDGTTTVLAALAVPTGLAARGDDLWVADWALGMVLQIVEDGRVMPHPVAQGLANPEGLAVTPDGSGLLVLEGGAGRLTHLDLATNETHVIADGLALSGALPFLDGVAVGPSGMVYVTGRARNVLYRIGVAESLRPARGR